MDHDLIDSIAEAIADADLYPIAGVHVVRQIEGKREKFILLTFAEEDEANCAMLTFEVFA